MKTSLRFSSKFELSGILSLLLLMIVLTACNQQSLDDSFSPPISEAAFTQTRAALSKTKRVHDWPSELPSVPKNGTLTIPLTVFECAIIGGQIKYWAGCSLSKIKCVAANGAEICIDKIK